MTCGIRKLNAKLNAKSVKLKVDFSQPKRQ